MLAIQIMLGGPHGIILREVQPVMTAGIANWTSLASLIVDQVGRLKAIDLLKATFLCEYLAGDGPLAPLLRKIPAATGKPRTELVEEALGVCAVLDCASFVRPHDSAQLSGKTRCGGDSRYWGVPWPPPDADDVPIRFRPEIPHPVPGKDESQLGYPVTFQLTYRFGTRPTITLELHRDGAAGPLVPCQLSTPTEPTNPKLAPEDAWCLIPDTPLQPDGKYTVTGRLRVDYDGAFEDTFSWSFRCGQ